MHVITSIDSSTLDALKDLARINVDSSACLEETARYVEGVGLGNLFLIMAQRRRGNVQALSSYVQVGDAEFELHGSLKGALHRWWLHLRASMQHENALVVVAWAERSEDAIRKAYERVLIRVAGNALCDVLHSQYREVMQNRDRIHDIRWRMIALKD